MRASSLCSGPALISRSIVSRLGGSPQGAELHRAQPVMVCGLNGAITDSGRLWSCVMQSHQVPVALGHLEHFRKIVPVADHAIGFGLWPLLERVDALHATGGVRKDGVGHGQRAGRPRRRPPSPETHAGVLQPRGGVGLGWPRSISSMVNPPEWVHQHGASSAWPPAASGIVVARCR
jgi:hypothetical protein